MSANVLNDTQKKAQDTGLADTASLASKGYGNKGWYGIRRDGGLQGPGSSLPKGL